MSIDRTKAPHIHDAIEFDYVLPPINTVHLDNGIPLYWLNAGVQEVAEIDWVFPSGLWFEVKEAVAHATAALIKNGTSKRSAHALSEALEFYGASLKAGASNDYGTLTLYALTKHLPELLPIVHEILSEAVFPEEEVAIYKQNSIQKLLVNQRLCEFVANQQIDAMLFGDHHPYGRFTKKESLEGLTRSDLLDHYNKQYALSEVKIFMSGRVGDAEVKSLNEVFGKIPLTKLAASTNTITAKPALVRKENIINDPNGVQGAIRIGRIFPNRHHPDYAPMVVLNTLFGGYFGSRLMSNIREDKGYTYGIHSSMTPYLHGGALTIHTEAGRDVLEAAVKEIKHEMQLLCNEPAEEEELLLVKNYLLGNLLGDLDGPFSIMQRWRTLILNDLNIEHFNRNINIYKTINAATCQELAQRYLNIDDFYEVVVV